MQGMNLFRKGEFRWEGIGLKVIGVSSRVGSGLRVVSHLNQAMETRTIMRGVEEAPVHTCNREKERHHPLHIIGNLR